MTFEVLHYEGKISPIAAETSLSDFAQKLTDILN